MKIEAQTVNEYISKIDHKFSDGINLLRNVILENLPIGFEECLSYGMLGYVVPHSIYPAGYHTNPKLPLPFINLAAQKNYIAFYHFGLYANTALLEWFLAENSKNENKKLDMGKSCIRFKKAEDIPLKLIAELVRKINVKDFIVQYEKNLKPKK